MGAFRSQSSSMPKNVTDVSSLWGELSDGAGSRYGHPEASGWPLGVERRSSRAGATRSVQSPRFSVSARQPKGWTLNTRRVCCTWVRCYQRSKTCPLLLLLRWPSLIRWGLPRMPENGSYGERQNPEPSMGLFCRPPYGGLCRGGGRWSHGCASLAVGYNLPPFGLSQRSLSRRGRA